MRTSTLASIDSEIRVKPSMSVNITVMRRGEPLGASAWPSATSWLITSTGTNLLNARRLRADSSSAWSRCWISSTRLGSRGRLSSSSRPMRRAVCASFSTGEVTSLDSRSDTNSAAASKARPSSSHHSTARRSLPSTKSSGTQLTSCQPVEGIGEACAR
ncbi:hypothetical protein [Variovorax paradoxus]|uniref:hypothetical protein n=1 Tax=Variovorax paradoxus TaxID=34073 RepID=UPI001E2B14AB|nr:hypothetical protein [Variovorax paradoxus]